jgi:putative glycosyl hydrolase
LRLALALAALAVSLCGAPAAWAARTEFFGIAQGPSLDATDRQGMQAARIQTDRLLLTWRVVEPSRNTYRWATTDLTVGGLASRGIRSVPFVWGSPSWVGTGNIARPPLDDSADKQAWKDFLAAAVSRYGPGGSYWANGGKYDQQFGASATPQPIQSWQIWNEPNLKRYFAPSPSAGKYAELLRISRNAIKSADPQAQIVLAGLFTDGDVKASTFLNNLYAVSGAKANFDAAALHPYGCNLDQTRDGIVKFRDAMTNHGDGATPLWITEFAWGSGPPDQFCKNKRETGQRDLLISSFNLILQNRTAWNLQRLYWFLWRDPASGSDYAQFCSICGTAGLLRNDRTKKPAYNAFTGFTAETTRPVASISGGPSAGSFTNDSTPTFSFASNEAGSTFVCRYDSSPFTACSSPYTRSLANGAHTFSVKAIDAPGNESLIVSRSFTVDTVPPQTTITSGPSGSTADTTPTFTFSSSESGSAFRCRYDSQAFAPCSGPGASHTPSTPLSLGSHSFAVTAIDKAKNFDPTPARRTFTVTP